MEMSQKVWGRPVCQQLWGQVEVTDVRGLQTASLLGLGEGDPLVAPSSFLHPPACTCLSLNAAGQGPGSR